MFKRLYNHVEVAGIGLYILKRIIDNAGGSTEEDSVKGERTIFRVHLKTRKAIVAVLI